MMTLVAMFLVLCVGLGRAGAQEKFTLKTAEAPPPDKLKPAFRELMDSRCVQVIDGKGQLHCEIWFRKVVPVKAADEQVKNGLTYREIPQTTVMGAIRFEKQVKDYRDQDVPAGVYVLRLAYQPQDGDHMGTAPYPEFCLVVAADKDAKPDLLEPKGLHDLSAKSLDGNHPGVFLLFPNPKPEAEPKIVDQGMGHWVVKQTLKIENNGKPATTGIGLTVVGKSASAE
jgi:hypothetical protein